MPETLALSSAWAGVIVGAVASLAAVAAVLIGIASSAKRAVRAVGKQTRKGLETVGRRISSLELAIATREAEDRVRREMEPTKDWVSGQLERALAHHENTCRARELEEAQISGVGPQPPQMRPHP